jgi:hypothetical protein
MKWALAAFILLHALLHTMGFAKAFGLAQLEALKVPIGRAAGVAWLVAGLLLVAAAVLIAIGPRSPGLAVALSVVGLVAALVSQAVIVTSWSDAKFGTLPNVVLLVFAGCVFAAFGPVGLRAEYRERSEALLARTRPGQVLTEASVASLPAPLRRYLEVSGAIGRPVPASFRARWRGRIRSAADAGWMALEAEQLNATAPAERLFFMEATMMGLPAIGLHAYVGDNASMDVRALGLVQVAEGHGAAMTRAETVTLFNDLAVLAPGALTAMPIAWTELAPNRLRGEFTNAGHTIAAELVFGEDGMLQDFVSNDRGRDVEGRFVVTRWSTPLSSPREFGGLRIQSRGEARWATAGEESFAYIELTLLELTHDPVP